MRTWMWLVVCGLWLCLAPAARATSISAWTWEAMQGLVQQSDTVFSGQVKELRPGDRNLADGRSTATVSVAEVFVGDAALVGQSITLTHSAADQPLRKENGLRLFFVARRGASYRLSFFHTFGALPIDGDKLAIWLEGKPHGQFYGLAEVVTRLRRYARARVEWTATVPKKVALSQGRIVIPFVARNLGSEPIKVLVPPHYFDAVWAQRMLESGQRASDEWSGVGHWEHIKGVEALRDLPTGGELRVQYAIPFSALGIKERGLYRLGVRLEGHRRSDKGDRAVARKDLGRIWLGGLDHFFVDVVVE